MAINSYNIKAMSASKTKRRVRPVIEEIVETAKIEPSILDSEVKKELETTKEEPKTEEILKEVTKYDEPVALPPADVELSSQRDDDEKVPLKVLFLITIVTALIVGFIAGGIYVYITGVSENRISEETPVEQKPETPTSTPKSTPMPTVTPKVDQYRVNVLNGSGIIGAAAKIKSLMEGAGFLVAGTGNAANYQFKTTLIQGKKDIPDAVLDLARSALSKEFEVEVRSDLPSSSTFDIIVTSGAK